MRQLPHASQHLARAVSRRAGDLSDSFSKMWPTSPKRSPRSPSKRPDRAVRQEAWNAEKDHLEKEFPRELRDDKQVNDNGTDDIYIIKIDGTPAYTGKTNNMSERWKKHHVREKIEAHHPGAKVDYEIVHRGARYGASLNALEELTMDCYDTLAKGTDPPGRRENQFRYNINPANRSVNGNQTTLSDIERLQHNEICDGGPSDPCDGNALFPRVGPIDGISTPVVVAEAAPAVAAAAATAATVVGGLCRGGSQHRTSILTER